MIIDLMVPYWVVYRRHCVQLLMQYLQLRVVPCYFFEFPFSITIKGLEITENGIKILYCFIDFMVSDWVIGHHRHIIMYNS